MSSPTFLLLNLALGFYNAGTIWAHEIDIFRGWRMVNQDDFPRIQRAHWRKLPYWVFFPVALGLIGGFALLWNHPPNTAPWLFVAALSCQVMSLLLTTLLWGPWQAKLSKDERGSYSPYLDKILSTHWIRTALINANAIFLLVAAIRS